MTFEEIQKIISNVQYKKWFVELYNTPEFVIRLSWFDTCSVTGKQMIQHSREWFMQPEGLTEDMVVQTIFKAIQNAEEHEVKERFRYKGKRVFNPHITINNLLEVCEHEDNV